MTKEKSYISLQKIATYRRNLQKTEKGRAASSVAVLFAFEMHNGIMFSCRIGNKYASGMSFDDWFLYKLSMKINKNGEKRFVFYKINTNGIVGNNRSRVLTTSPNKMRAKIESISIKPVNSKQTIPAAQTRRMLVFIRAFLRKHGVSIKGLSSDPFSLMFQLCYPGSACFDESTLRYVSTSRYLLRDPVKSVLKTNGKFSRKLIYQVIKAYPLSINPILSMARYLRTRKSLSHAQHFLREVLDTRYGTFSDDSFCEHRLIYARSSKMRIFDRLGISQLVIAVQHPQTISDIFMMIEQLNGDNGFGFDEIEYTTLSQLHDTLSRLAPRSRKRGKAFKHYMFDVDSDPMRLCALLCERMGDTGYDISYAKGTEELRKQADMMHNCSFFYHDRISSGRYAIFCVNKKYMFGVSLAGIVVKLDQAVTYCNGAIDKDTIIDINSKIEEAIDGSGMIYLCTHHSAYNILGQAAVR